MLPLMGLKLKNQILRFRELNMTILLGVNWSSSSITKLKMKTVKNHVETNITVIML